MQILNYYNPNHWANTGTQELFKSYSNVKNR